MPRPLLLAVLVPAALLSLACSAARRPTASLRSSEVGEVTPAGFTVNFGFDVENPNDFDLPLRNADYALSLGGVRVIDDKVERSDSLRARERTTVTLPVRLAFDDLLKAGQALRAGGGDVPFTFDGALGFGGGGGGLAMLGVPDRIPLRYSGTLPLRRLVSDPRVLLNSPAARRLAQWGLGALTGQ